LKIGVVMLCDLLKPCSVVIQYSWRAKRFSI
jgi:hypothetical protein